MLKGIQTFFYVLAILQLLYSMVDRADWEKDSLLQARRQSSVLGGGGGVHFVN